MIDLKQKYNCKNGCHTNFLDIVVGGGTIRFLLGVSESGVLYQHQKLLRKTEYYYNSGHGLLYRLYFFRLHKIQLKYGLRVPVNTCAKGLKIIHVGSVLIHPDAAIGKNCGININTAIAVNGNKNGAPIIGDNVTIGTGATIIGPIRICDNVIIGANSLVCKSVDEENIAVAGNPAHKISNNGALTWI